MKKQNRKPYTPKTPEDNKRWCNPPTGKLETIWVVRDATSLSTLIDICFETTPDRFALYVLGAGDRFKGEHHTFYADRASAEADAFSRLAEADALCPDIDG